MTKEMFWGKMDGFVDLRGCGANLGELALNMSAMIHHAHLEPPSFCKIQ